MRIGENDYTPNDLWEETKKIKSLIKEIKEEKRLKVESRVKNIRKIRNRKMMTDIFSIFIFKRDRKSKLERI